MWMSSFSAHFVLLVRQVGTWLLTYPLSERTGTAPLWTVWLFCEWGLDFPDPLWLRAAVGNMHPGDVVISFQPKSLTKFRASPATARLQTDQMGTVRPGVSTDSRLSSSFSRNFFLY